MPADDRVLALCRAKASTSRLKEDGVHSYKVFFFEQSKGDSGFISPAHSAEQAMSALTTHDMPTLKGFWHCDDLALGRELGLYPDEEVLKTLYARSPPGQAADP